MTAEPIPDDTPASPPPARRQIRFASLDEVRADVNRLAAAHTRAALRRAGDWTFAQNLNHLATWIDYSYDGPPMKVPFFLRLILGPLKRRFLYSPMPKGVRIPRVTGGTFAIDAVPDDVGLAHFRTSVDRLGREPPAGPHMVFGRLTHDEWINMHLRHCELHLSHLSENA